MKLRKGFVSNSSSSSFICETEMSIEEVTEKLEKLAEIIDANPSYMWLPPFIAHADYLEDWRPYDPEVIDVGGKLVIESVSDNTIPYCLFDLIEYLFNARRVHLG
jgi:hypothetical protein